MEKVVKSQSLTKVKENNSMRIAQLAPLWKPVPPKKYGGTELMVANLSEELQKLGADVTVFCCGGSTVNTKRVEVIDKPMYDLVNGFNFSWISPYEFLTFEALFARLKDFDIVHNHLGIHPLVFAPLLQIPVVTTLDSSVPPDFPYLAKRFKNNLFTSISDAQRANAPYLNYLETIHHGIDLSGFKPCFDLDNDYLFFIGTLSHSKGIHLAVRAAKELGEKLIIAGEIREDDKAFLDKEVWPLVDGENIRFIGEVGHKEKATLYAKAKAVLFPIQWNEAFGLVMIEALASGTPVIAYQNGSVAEVIEDGKTGFIVKTFSQFKRSIKHVGQISRVACREAAEQRFDRSIMAKNYLALFQKITKLD